MDASITSPDIEKPLPAKWQAGGLWRYSFVLLAVIIAAVPIGYSTHQYFQKRSIVAYEQQCHELKVKKDWTQLAKIAEAWSAIEPTVADPWLYRGEAAEGLSDWKSLVQYLDRVPRSDPRAVGALLTKAIVEFEKLNRPWDGAKTCDEVLELNPLVLVAHKQTVFFYMMTLQRKEALRRVRRAIHLRRESPETYVFLVSATWLNPAALYQNNTIWLESDPENEIFEVARAMPIYTTSAKDDPKQAEVVEHIPAAEKLLEKYPQNPELLAFFIGLGITNGDLDRVQELLKTFPRELADTDARYWRARAWCEDALGEYELSEKSLRRGFALDPYWWVIHFQLHDLLRRLGRIDEATYFHNAYQIAKDLSIKITSLNKSPENLDERKFCRELLVLAELIEDDEVIDTLKERVAVP